MSAAASYDLSTGPRNPHRVFHNGEARFCLERERQRFQPMTETEHAAILADLPTS